MLIATKRGVRGDFAAQFACTRKQKTTSVVELHEGEEEGEGTPLMGENGEG